MYSYNHQVDIYIYMYVAVRMSTVAVRVEQFTDDIIITVSNISTQIMMTFLGL